MEGTCWTTGRRKKERIMWREDEEQDWSRTKIDVPISAPMELDLVIALYEINYGNIFSNKMPADR